METNPNYDELAAFAAAVLVLSAAYGSAFGKYQTKFTDAVIDAFRVDGRFKQMTNFAVGILIAISFTCIAALKLGDWTIAPVGILAGILASVTASETHDAQKEARVRPDQTVLKRFSN